MHNILFCVVTLFSYALSIQEHDFGKLDFLLQNIGEPTNTIFLQKNLVVVTEKNVVSSLQSDSGKIEWRAVLQDQILYNLPTSKSIICVTKNGFQSFDISNGALQWQENIENSFDTFGAVEISDDFLAILTNNTVFIVKNSVKREILLQKHFDDFNAVKLFHSLKHGLVVAGNSKTGLSIVKFDIKTQQFSSLVQTKLKINPRSSLIVNENNIFFDYQDHLIIYNIDNNVATESIELKQYNPSNIPNFFQTCKSNFARFGAKHIIYHANVLKDSVTLLINLENTQNVKTFKNIIFSVDNGSLLYYENNKNFNVLKLNQKSELVELKYKVELEGEPKNIWHSIRGDEILTTVRAVDESFSLYKVNTPKNENFQKLWKREEALSFISSSIFVDLPVDKTKYNHLKEEFEKNYFSRFFSQLSHISSGVSKFFSRKNGNSKVVMTRDHFGYRKLIVAITKVGHVFALHSSTGAMIWSRHFNEYNFESVFEVKGVNSTTVLIVGKETNRNDATLLIELNSLTGELINKQQTQKIILAKQLSITGKSTKAIVLVDDNLNVLVYPKSYDELLDHINKIFFYTSSSEGVLNGYGLSNTSSQIKAVLRWSKSLFQTASHTCTANQNGVCELNNEKLVSVIQNKISESIPARGLANGGVLWKYLNPNLIVATTVNTNDATITLYFIDVITGRLLYSISHNDAHGPVHVVVENNWVVYHYWSSKSHCYFLSVIDLYELQPQWKRQTFSSVSDVPYKKNAAQTNFQVFKQTYMFPSSVTAMATTTSNLGMSNPHILVGLSRNSILALDKRIIDARRPVRATPQPTEEDFKEGVMPYRPVVEISPLHFITFNQSVQQLRFIYTAPAELESTTLVIAHGLDVYYVATSGISGKTFDRLDPNFDTPFLVIVCSVIFILTVASHFYAKSNNLQQSWK